MEYFILTFKLMTDDVEIGDFTDANTSKFDTFVLLALYIIKNKAADNLISEVPTFIFVPMIELPNY